MSNPEIMNNNQLMEGVHNDNQNSNNLSSPVVVNFEDEVEKTTEVKLKATGMLGLPVALCESSLDFGLHRASLYSITV